MSQSTIDWVARQEGVLQRSIAGGGKPEFPQTEPLIGKKRA